MRAPRAERRKLRQYERALLKMSESERTCLLGVAVDDLSYEAVAAKLGLTVEEVEDHLTGALRIIGEIRSPEEHRKCCFW